MPTLAVDAILALFTTLGNLYKPLKISMYIVIIYIVNK
jgi:hypothetical protein